MVMITFASCRDSSELYHCWLSGKTTSASIWHELIKWYPLWLAPWRANPHCLIRTWARPDLMSLHPEGSSGGKGDDIMSTHFLIERADTGSYRELSSIKGGQRSSCFTPLCCLLLLTALSRGGGSSKVGPMCRMGALQQLLQGCWLTGRKKEKPFKNCSYRE